MSSPRRFLVALVAVALAAPLAGDASARLSVGGPGPGYFASDNVEYVGHVPFNNDSAGARIVGDHLYLTTSRDLRIFDISEPTAPRLTGSLILPQDLYFSEEDPDTNGKILLVGAQGELTVIDVEDKTNPQVIGTLAGADAHTTTCVLNCTWVYNSNGQIVDIRNPTKPKLAGNWGEGMPAKSGHDVTEVARGLIVTSSQPLMVLDARKDPAHPKLLALGSNADGRFIHGNQWPRRGRDRFLLVGGESGVAVGGCNETDAAFMTWDTAGWRKTRTLSMIDEYHVQGGLPTDGNMPADLFCAHWFDAHPRFRNGGLVAMGWYEHGTRFLKVDAKGKISEVGYFIPLAGSTSAAYWVTNDIVYAVDYNRGLDIIRLTD